jgi:hypothetical protein
MPSLMGVGAKGLRHMGIYAAPPNGGRNRPPVSGFLGWIAVALTIASVATFALVGGAGVGSAWLVIALGEALLALALLICSGPSRQSIDSYSPGRKTSKEIDEAAERVAASRPPGAELGTHPRQKPRTRQPISVAERQATRAQRFAAQPELLGVPIRRRRFTREKRAEPARSEVGDAATDAAEPARELHGV